MNRAGNQRDRSAAGLCGRSNGVTHFAGGIVSQVTNRVDTLHRGPGRDENPKALQVAGAGCSSFYGGFTMICAGSLMRPAPVSPQARKPAFRTDDSGRRGPAGYAGLACVASAVHMPVFMAGASRMGALVASSVVVSMSSAMPQASLAIRLAVAGATSISIGLLRQGYMPDVPGFGAGKGIHTHRARAEGFEGKRSDQTLWRSAS